MPSLRSDLALALRLLAKSPGFTAAAALTLALGVGATSTVFGLLDALLWRPLPGVEAPERLALVFGREGSGEVGPGSYLDFRDFEGFDRAGDPRFEALAAFKSLEAPVTIGGAGGLDRRAGATLVTEGFFPALGTRPALGRALSFAGGPGEDGAGEAVISHELWRSAFGGSPAALGETIRVRGVPLTIVGVAPAGFQVPPLERADDVFVSMALQPSLMGDDLLEARGWSGIYMVGRLAPGVTTSAAQAALDTWAARLEREYPGSNAGRAYHLEPLSRSRVPPYARGTVTTVSAVLAAAALAVLIIACLDVAGLFGVRASRRAREAAIRSAIGAPRSAIVRQLLVESLVLSALGALGALAVTALLASVAGRLPFPLPIEPRIDPRVLGFTFAVAGACGVLIGLLPALRIARRDLTPLTRRADRPATARLRGGLIVTQVALSLGLVLIASLLLRTVVELQDVPIGFDSGSLVVADVGPATARDAATYSRIVEGVLAAPGVGGVSVTGRLPGDSGGDGLGMRPEGAGEETRSLSVATVGDGFFETLGVPILAGRDLGAGDAAGAPLAVVVNRSLAERFWSVETAVGRRIELVGTPFSLTVAGVAEDVRVGALRSAVEPMVFASYRQNPVVPSSLRLVARTGLAPDALAPVIREAVAAAGGWSGEISTLEERVRGSVAAERAMSISLWSLGLTALLLAAVGLYGLLAFAVGERRHEIGVRMALGADGARVRRMVVGRGLALTLAGVALGLLAGVSAADAIEGLLYGVGSLDPVSLAGSCLLLVAVAVAASWVPAARAARLDPVTVLRRE